MGFTCGYAAAAICLGDAITERRQIDAGIHRFALSQHHPRQCEVQVVDQPGAKILTSTLYSLALEKLSSQRSYRNRRGKCKANKVIEPRPYTNPQAAAQKRMEIANGIEPRAGILMQVAVRM
jgi:hypothetical protein